MNIDFPFRSTERLLISHLAFIIISGATFLLLSPLRYFPQIPLWLSNPFSGSSTDILTNFLAFLVCTIAVGTLLSPFKDFVLGKGGLNEKLRDWLPVKRGSTKKQTEGSIDGKTSLEPEDFPEYVKFVVEQRLSPYAEYLSIQYAVVSGIILGTEISFFSYIFVIYFVCTYQFLLEMAIFPLILLIVLLTFVVYNSEYFRDYNDKRWGSIIAAFYKHRDKKKESK